MDTSNTAPKKKERIYLWAVRPSPRLPLLGGALKAAEKAAHPMKERATAALEQANRDRIARERKAKAERKAAHLKRMEEKRAALALREEPHAGDEADAHPHAEARALGISAVW